MKPIAYKEMYENELSHPWYTYTRKRLLRTFKTLIKTEAKILDLGCGTGGTLIKLKDAGFKNIYGLDKSNAAIEYCKKRKLENLVIGNINTLPYKAKSFDAIVCLDVLYHEGVNLELALNEIYRVLKRGGICYLQEPALDWLKSQHDLAVETKTRFTKTILTSALRRKRFRIIYSTYYNTFLLPFIILKRLIDKTRKKDQVSSDVYQLPPVISAVFSFVLNFENIITLNSGSLPFGLSIIIVSKK
ncbi:MAG: class I SAM-dependent methyltransferase [Patescibacteria group bacterium]